MATTIILEAVAKVNADQATKSIGSLEKELELLQEQFKTLVVGSDEFKKVGDRIREISSEIKTLDERFEGLGAEQTAAGIVDSFNVLAGSVGAVTGALVAFGVESEELENVERRLLGIITVVSSLREVSNGLGQAQKTLIPLIQRVGTSLRTAFAANPILLAVTAVAALTAAVVTYIRTQKEAANVGEEVIKLTETQTKDIAKQQAQLIQLRDIVLDVNASEENRIGALEQLKKLIPELNDVTLDQADAIDKVTIAVGREIAAIKERARIAAVEERLQKAISDNLLLLEGLNEASEGLVTTQAELETALRINENAFENSSTGLRQLARDYRANQKLIAEYSRQLAEANEELAAFKPEEDAAKKAAAAKAAAANARKVTEEQIKALIELALPYDQFIERLRKIRGVTAKDIPEATKLAAEAWNKADQELKQWIADQAKYLERVDDDLTRYTEMLQRPIRQLQLTEEEVETLTGLWEELNEEVERYNFFTEDQLDIIRRLREGNKTALQEQLDALENQYNEELKLFADNEEYKSQLTEEYEQNRAKVRRQYAIQTAQELFGITSQFLTTIADINQQSLELQLAQAAGNQEAITRINEEALEKQKKLRIAQTIITTAESILNGFNATSTLPPPFNLIAGGVLAAAYGALGAKTIQNIQATTLEGGSSTASGFNNIPRGTFGSINLGGGATANVPNQFGGLPGLGGGRVATPTVGTVAEGPIRAYVLAGDVENGVQANISLNSRRRLAG